MRAFRVPNAEFAGRKAHMSGTEARRYRRDSARYWLERPEPKVTFRLDGAPPCRCHDHR